MPDFAGGILSRARALKRHGCCFVARYTAVQRMQPWAARIDRLLEPARPYSHLAIHPYPEEFTRTAKLVDGGEVLVNKVFTDE